MEIDCKVIEILRDLVRVNSVNPFFPNGPGEEEIAVFVNRYLKKIGVKGEIQHIEQKRKNVVAVVPGTNHNKTLLLNAHLDTFGVEEMAAPFDLRKEGDKLFGRGTYDMKGSIAIMLLLAEYLNVHRPLFDILFTFVADEEAKSIGMEYLINNLRLNNINFPVAGVFLEPTELKIGVSHKGFAWYEIEVIGKGAHGSEPEEGIDAIFPLTSALLELNRIRTKLIGDEGDPLLGHASLHVGLIEGGTALSAIPSKSRLQWERRTLPSESHYSLNSEFIRVVQVVENVPGNHHVRGKEILIRPSHCISDQSPIVRSLKRLSPDSDIVGLSFWADSALSASVGIPSVVFGPIGNGAHTMEEWVSLKSLITLYEILKKLTVTFE
jgi:acetylornithine deacetylase